MGSAPVITSGKVALYMLLQCLLLILPPWWDFVQQGPRKMGLSHLFQSLVVDKACCILGDLKLPFLDLFSKLPVAAKTWVSSYMSARKLLGQW